MAIEKHILNVILIISLINKSLQDAHVGSHWIQCTQPRLDDGRLV